MTSQAGDNQSNPFLKVIQSLTILIFYKRSRKNSDFLIYYYTSCILPARLPARCIIEVFGESHKNKKIFRGKIYIIYYFMVLSTYLSKVIQI